MLTRSVNANNDTHLTGDVNAPHTVLNCGPYPVYVGTKNNGDGGPVMGNMNNCTLVDTGESIVIKLDDGFNPNSEGVYARCAVDSSTSFIKTWES